MDMTEQQALTFYHQHSTALIIFAIYFVISMVFCAQVQALMQRIPAEKRLFPAWLIWLSLVPYAGLVVQWMVMPWGVGKSLQRLPQQALQDQGNVMYVMGISYAICATMSLFASQIFIFIALALWVFYWVKLTMVHRQMKEAGY